MKTILVPIDFTDNAANSLAYATELARLTGARLILFHAFELPVSVGEVQVMVLAVEELKKAYLERLHELEMTVQQRTGGAVPTECIARSGLAVVEILSLSDELEADLVIMGVTGRGMLSELIIGSHAASTFRKSRVPVLIVPRDAAFRKIDRIVLASDLHQVTRPVQDRLVALVRVFGARLLIVNVLQHERPASVEEAAAERSLERLLEGLDHSFHFHVNEDIVGGINEFAAEHAADLIVTIPHKHSLWHRLIHEGISTEMAFNSRLPLLTVPDHMP